METRDAFIISLRGETIGSVNESSSADEKFQNQTLRPILKLQNDLFVEVFKNHISKHKNDFYMYSVEKKLQFIENTIQKDIKFRNALKGIVIGLLLILSILLPSVIRNLSRLRGNFTWRSILRAAVFLLIFILFFIFFFWSRASVFAGG